MKNLLGGVKLSQTTGLEKLSDEQLQEYFELTQNLTKRESKIILDDFDTKAAYHLIRLVLECEQILNDHNIDIEANAGILRSVRGGEWTMDRIYEWFSAKELSLIALHANSTLQTKPDMEKIKELLMTCIEMHYGNIGDMVNTSLSEDSLANDIQHILDKWRITNEHSFTNPSQSEVSR